MDYFAIYDRLVSRARERDLDGYFERHHVLPRCMGGNDDPSNIVKLTAEEHYIAHQLLAKMYPYHPTIWLAAIMMTARPGNKVYGWLRRRMSEHMKANNPNKGGHARRAYIAKNGPIVFKSYNLSGEGRERIISKMIGPKNPQSGKKPWRVTSATEQSKAIWADAQRYYDWWQQNPTRSYHFMAKQHAFEKPTMAHNNLIRYFRDGWIPVKDADWIEFSENHPL